MAVRVHGWTIGLAALIAAGSLQAAPPHQHGVAQLDVAVDKGRVSIELQTPLDNLLGFERAPRSDAERDKVAAAVAKLRDGQTLFRIDAAAGCTLVKAELDSLPLQLGNAQAKTSAAAGDHADLDGHYEFRCKDGARAGSIEVGLFEAFAGLSRIELQVQTPKGQIKATLRRPASRVVLVR